MLLIALSGGLPAERLEIAERLVRAAKVPLVAFVQTTPSADYAMRRLAILKGVLDGPGEVRGEHSPVEGVVIAHCLTEEEAAEVRKRGGVVWHVYGKPSRVVGIRQGEVMVTADVEGFRHVREPMEALSELLLSLLANNGTVRAALEGLADE